MRLNLGAKGKTRVVGGRILGAALLVIPVIGASVGICPDYAYAQSAEQNAVFDIKAGPLANALAAFGQQSGLQVTYLPELAHGKMSPGARGTLVYTEALEQILYGSGLSYSFTNAHTVTITAVIDESIGAADDMLILDPIDVTGMVQPQDEPYETPGSGSYISREQIDRFRGGTAGDIFKNTTGVIAASNHNGAALDVNIRGMQGQNRVKVAIDGTQQTSTTWRGYIGVDERTYIDPDLIGGVDIAKGPTGGAAGAGATGGVVSIRTLNAKDIVKEGEEFGVRLRVGASDNAISPQTPPAYMQRTTEDAPDFFDFENYSGSAAIATSLENFDFIAAVAKRKTGNYFAGSKGDDDFEFMNRIYPLSFTLRDEEVFNSSDESLSLLTRGTIHFFDDHSLELSFMRYDSEFGESMGSLLFQQDNGFRQVNLSEVTADTYTARYRWTPDEDLLDLRFNIWASDVAQTTRAVASAPDFSQFGFIPADEPRFTETWTYGGDINNTSLVLTDFGDFTFNYGLSYQLEDADGEEYCSRTYTRNSCVILKPSIGTRELASVFSSAEWIVTDWLKFDGTLRYDAYQLEDKAPVTTTGVRKIDGGRVSPTASVTLTPLEGLQFFALYAEGMRPPTMRETMGSDANSIPNPYLDAEITRNWEIGANFSQDGLLFEDDKVRLKASYFRNNHYNYISRVASNAGPGQPVFTFGNLDRLTLSGIEISGGYDLGPLFTEGSLTYYTDYAFCPTASTCGDAAVMYDYATNHVPPDLAWSLTAGARLFDGDVTFGARMTYAGERIAPLTTTDRSRTAVWLPYTIVDAFASFQVLDTVTLDLNAENIFDVYYVDALNGWMPSPGRTIRASLTASF